MHSVWVEARPGKSQLLLLHLGEKSAVSGVLFANPLGCQVRVHLHSTSWTTNYVVVSAIRDIQRQIALSISLESGHGIGGLHATIIGRHVIHRIHLIVDAARICIISHAVLIRHESINLRYSLLLIRVVSISRFHHFNWPLFLFQSICVYSLSNHFIN